MRIAPPVTITQSQRETLQQWAMSGVNYFFRSATISFPYQRQLLLRRRGAPPPRGRAQPAERPVFGS